MKKHSQIINVELFDSFEILQRLNFEVGIYLESASTFQEVKQESEDLEMKMGYMVRATYEFMELKVQCFIDEYRNHFYRSLLTHYGNKFSDELRQIDKLLNTLTGAFDIKTVRDHFIAHGFRISKGKKSVFRHWKELENIKRPNGEIEHLFVKKCIHDIDLVITEIHWKIRHSEENIN